MIRLGGRLQSRHSQTAVALVDEDLQAVVKEHVDEEGQPVP